MIQERRADILEALIRQFIETGEPVSSHTLYERHDFGIKPAMIRLELTALTDDNYLEQPYHSAGRVPADRGYRFFVERVLGEDVEAVAPRMRTPESMLQALADELGMLTVFWDGAEVRSTGFETLMERVAWGSREAMLRIIADYEALEDRLARARYAHDRDLSVFVGENPFTESEDLAVFCVPCADALFLGIAPKRTDYERAVRAFRGISSAYRKQNNHHS